MIAEYKLYHGAVIAELVHELNQPVTIDELNESGRLSAYIINSDIGLQIKHCSNRLHPWQFTFTRQNMLELLALQNSCGRVFLALVCHTDGIICLTLDEVVSLIGSPLRDQLSLRAKRRPRQWYEVCGLGDPVKRPGGLDLLVAAIENASASPAVVAEDADHALVSEG